MLDRDRISSYIQEQLEAGESYASISVARKAIAQETGQIIEPGTLEAKIVDEAIELALVKISRNIVQADNPIATFDNLLDLYARQPTLGVRSSTSAKQQAYSTVLPLAYLASELAGISKNSRVFEPTAGNGALLIAADPGNCTVNELNPDRAQQLRSQGFTVTEHDATEFLPEEKHDVVIANPPFGRVKGKRFRIPGNPRGTSQIDQAIAFQGLQAMKDDGRAVLILGGKNETEPIARSEAYNTLETRAFYYLLHQQYNVVDHFTVSGDLYRKQGAGWPIDFIVIEGRGQSNRPLPAVEPPRIYESFEEIRGFLNDYLRQNFGNERVHEDESSMDSRREREPSDVLRQASRGMGNDELSGIRRDDETQARMADAGSRRERDSERGVTSGLATDSASTQPDSGSSEHDGRRGGRETVVGVGIGLGGESIGIQSDLVRMVSGDESRNSLSSGSEGLPQLSERNGTAQRNDPRSIPDGTENTNPINYHEPKITMAEELNIPYQPRSQGRSPGTLIPRNMAVAAQKALSDFEAEHGNIDDFVQQRLGYSSKAAMFERLYAEQIDSLALGFVQKDKDRVFLNGDQTGNGKGRFGAANIIDAKRQGYTPIFVTQKPNLYAAMMEDISDIGFDGLRPFMTNNKEIIDLHDGSTLRSGDGPSQEAEMYRISQSEDLGGYDVIFTTYNQLQTVKGKEPFRREFLRAIAPNAVFIFDEAHEAGGTAWDTSGPPNRAQFVRELVDSSAGAVFMSATATKSPSVMDLYARRTDARYAVQSMGQLENTLKSGGIPLQQMMATQFVSAGNMLRRERSFDNISFESKQVPVDHEITDQISAVMRAIDEFDKEKQKSIRELRKEVTKEAKKVTEDNSIGEAGVKSTNFTSLMHNAIEQGLLAQKAESTVQEAIAALERGEKPVIALANTMDSFIGEYAKESGLKAGDEINISFGDVLSRYLERSRDVMITDAFGRKDRIALTDEQLGLEALSAYEEAAEIIAETDWSKIPLSSIDYIKYRLEQEGYRIDEITGRQNIIQYGDEGLTYALRSNKETSARAKIDVVDRFNTDQIDVVILNRSGATGISLHASEKLSKQHQQQRHMIVAQAERDINQFMQMLGRVNRFGQVVEPKFTLVMADVPAEKRLGAILAKKMASLNANTTAGRETDLSVSNMVDFINAAGEEVITELLEENPDLEAKLSNPSSGQISGDYGLIEKVTGRIPLLPLDEQEELYEIIESETLALIEQKEAMGENVLRADQLDLDAKTLSRMEVEPADPSRVSEFTGPVILEVVDAKVVNKPPTQLQVINRVRENLGEASIKSVDDHDFEATRNLAIAKTKELEKSITATAAEYRQGIAVRARSPKHAEKQRETLATQLTTITGTFDQFPPGQTVEIISSEGKKGSKVTYGVVLDLTQKRRMMGSPIAPSNWKMQLLTREGKQVSIPFSKINNGKSSGLSVQPVAQTFLKRDIYEEFDRLQQAQRSQMQVFTGNLLKAYEKFPTGKFVNFTDNQGNTRQGLLMNEEFDIVQKLRELPVAVESPEQVKHFIETLTDGQGVVESDDGNLKIRADTNARISGGAIEYFVLTVPDSNKQGGKYFLNEDLTDAANEDFYSVGGRMELKVEPEDLEEVAKILMTKLETKLVVSDTGFKELLRQHLGQAIPTLEKVADDVKVQAESSVVEQPQPEQQGSLFDKPFEPKPIDLAPPPSQSKSAVPEAMPEGQGSSIKETSEPNSSIGHPESSKIPDEVRERIEWAIAGIRNYNKQIDNGRSLDGRFGGEGRYEFETHEKLVGSLNQDLELLEKFKELAPKNEIDAQQVLEELSFVEPTELSSQAKEWLPAPSLEAEQPPAETEVTPAIADQKAVLPPTQQGSEAAKNIAQLLHDAGIEKAVLTGEDFHIRAEQPHFLPLVIERHIDKLYLSHYREMNGDSFIEAEMIFNIGDRGNLSLQEVASFNPLTGGELRNKDRSFANLFSKNLLDQGWAGVISETREETKQTQPEVNSAPIIAEVKASEAPQAPSPEKNVLMAPQAWAKVAQAIGHKPDYVAKVMIVQEKPLTEKAIGAMKRDFEIFNNNLETLREWYANARSLNKPHLYLDEIRQIAADFKQGQPLSQGALSSSREDWSVVKFKQFAHGIEENPKTFIRDVANNALSQGSDRKEWKPMPFRDISDILIKGNSGLRDTFKLRPDGVKMYVNQSISEAMKQLPKEKQAHLMKADPDFQKNLRQAIQQQPRNRGPSL